MRVMKDSGIEWIGQVPECWEIRRLQYILRERNEKNIPVKTSEILSLTASQGVIPHAEKEGGGNKPKEDLSAYKLAYPDDIVMNSMNVLSGAVGLSKYYGCVSPVYYMLYSDDENIDIRFYNYMFKTKAFQRSLMGLGNGILIKESDNGTLNTIRMRIPMEKLSKLNFIVPSIGEQRKIVEFLEGKIPELDAMIAKTKESVEQYKKYKQAIITEAVTKGVDKTVTMKDSGIEWIGSIPTEFQCIKLRHCVKKIGDVDHYMPETVVEGIPYVMTGDLQEKVSDIYFDSCKMISEEDYLELSKKIVAEQGDVILARYATIGTVCYVDMEKEFIVSYSCVVIKPKKCLDGKYLFNYSKSSAFEEELKKYTNSNTQGNVGIDSLYQAKIVLPSVEMQEEIVAYLDMKCAEINELIAKKEAIVEELVNYKQSLIYEYVTGKKEVL